MGMGDDKVTSRTILAEFLIWVDTFTFHDNMDGPTSVSTETMLNILKGASK
jgi:hypothetical protein